MPRTRQTDIDPARRDRARKSVRDAFAQAKQIRDKETRNMLLGDVAQAMARVGLYAEAVQIVHGLDVEVQNMGTGRDDIAGQVAIAMADQRAFADAIKLAQEVHASEDEAQVVSVGRADTLAAIAERCAKAGDIPLALRVAALAQRAESLDPRSGEPYHRIVPEQARRGDVDGAFASLDAIGRERRSTPDPIPELEAKALGALAAVLKATKAPGGMARCDARLATLRERAGDAGARDEVLHGYVSGRAETGDPDGALPLVAQIVAPETREKALQAIVDGSARLRRFALAQQALDQIRTPAVREEAHLALAEAQIDAGEHAAARATLDHMDRWKGEQIDAQLLLRAKMGDADGLFATIDRVRKHPLGKESYGEGGIFQIVAAALARNGRWDAAEKLVSRMPPLPSRYASFVLSQAGEIAEIWSAFAVAHLQKGDRAGADRCLDRAKKASQMAMGDQFPRALVLSGDIAGAVRVVEAFRRYPSLVPELGLGGAMFAMLEGMTLRQATYYMTVDGREADTRRFIEKLSSPTLRAYGFLGIADGHLGRPPMGEASAAGKPPRRLGATSS